MSNIRISLSSINATGSMDVTDATEEQTDKVIHGFFDTINPQMITITGLGDISKLEPTDFSNISSQSGSNLTSQHMNNADSENKVQEIKDQDVPKRTSHESQKLTDPGSKPVSKFTVAPQSNQKSETKRQLPLIPVSPRNIVSSTREDIDPTTMSEEQLQKEGMRIKHGTLHYKCHYLCTSCALKNTTYIRPEENTIKCYECHEPLPVITAVAGKPLQSDAYKNFFIAGGLLRFKAE